MEYQDENLRGMGLRKNGKRENQSRQFLSLCFAAFLSICFAAKRSIEMR